MHIILVNPRGFCAGVKMAVEALTVALNRFGPPIYVYHEIVHNSWVVEEFRRQGVRFVDYINAVPPGSRLLFSAHGVSPAIRKIAEEQKLYTIDATCPLVNKVHKEVIRLAKEGYTILLLGHRGHDEIIGIVGEAPDTILVVETLAEIDAIHLPPNEKPAYLTQTTLSVDKAQSMITVLKQRFPEIVGPPTSDICYATQNRQDAVKELCQEADVVLVIGSVSSSNSRRLAECAAVPNVRSELVDGPDDIDFDWFNGSETVLVTAGASAPERIVCACIDKLRSRFETTIEERVIREERTVFQLPDSLVIRSQ